MISFKVSLKSVNLNVASKGKTNNTEYLIVTFIILKPTEKYMIVIYFSV